MSGDIQLVGSFVTDDACAEAIEALHHAKIVSFRTFSPFPSEKIAEHEARIDVARVPHPAVERRRVDEHPSGWEP